MNRAEDVDAAIERARTERRNSLDADRALLAEEVMLLRARLDWFEQNTDTEHRPPDDMPCGICGETYPHHHDDEVVEQDHLGLGLRKDWR